MRPGQNRRVRGRNRSKGPNPLTRAFESNGPDVKIRGTAQHVADKYAQLARDAQASGDPVSAENYLQHAEHYYRLIAAAQEQLRQQYPGTYGRDEDGDEGDDEAMPSNGYGYPAGAGDEDGEGAYGGQATGYEGRNGGDNRFSNEGRQAPEPRQNGGGQQQPRYDNRPNDRGGQTDRGGQNDRGGQRFDRNGGGYDRNGGGTNGYDRNGERFDRNGGGQGGQGGGQYDRQDGRNDPRQGGGRDRFGNGSNREGRRDYNRNDRPQGDRPQGERAYADRGQGERAQGDRNQGERQQGDRPYGDRQPERFARERPAPAPRQDFADEAPEDNAGAGLPAFLTTPVRAPVAAASSVESQGESGPSDAYAGGGDTLPFEEGEAARPRRRRTRRPMAGSAADEVASAGPDAPVE